MIPNVNIHLDKERVWQANLSAFIALDQALGADAFDRIQKVSEGGKVAFNRETIEVFRALIWCGLQSEPDPPSLEIVAAHLTPRRMLDVVEQVLPAFNESVAGRPTDAAARSANEVPAAK